jgi:hypothetical protein
MCRHNRQKSGWLVGWVEESKVRIKIYVVGQADHGLLILLPAEEALPRFGLGPLLFLLVVVVHVFRLVDPAVADHVHAPGFGFAVILCALFEILLAADTLRVAESGLGECVDITPCYNLVSHRVHFFEKKKKKRSDVNSPAAISKHLRASTLSCSVPQPFIWLTPNS